ncbi:MAG: TIGR00730 family Rossman fold protein [Paludibacteraceae bacterium]|nr:TIGR00730 family Rossman fold protein [Paludibacteraceae bacterium]
MKNIAVYCASSSQVRQVYYDEAYRLGRLLAAEHIGVVYGDGGIGLMGRLASGVLDGNGKITGVIPQFMVDEGWNNTDSTRTIVVNTMHERKAKIARLSDGMVALPGGMGTFEELLECLTWKQLGLHAKPVVILNTEGYYDFLLAAIDRMVEEKFIRPVHREMYTVVRHAEDVIPALRNAKPWDKATRRDAAV